MTVSLKWIEVASKEMKWITKEQMMKAYHVVIFVEVIFVLTYFLCMVVAHSYIATAILTGAMSILIAGLFWKGATMVCKKLEIQAIKRALKPEPVEDDNVSNCAVVMVDRAWLSSSSSSQAAEPTAKRARPKIFKYFRRKVHPGPENLSGRQDGNSQTTRISYPPSEGAVAIMVAAKFSCKICGACIACASVYTIFEPSLRFNAVAAVSIVLLFALGMLVNFRVLAYVMRAKTLSFRNVRAFSTQAFKQLKYHVSQRPREMLRKITTQMRRK